MNSSKPNRYGTSGAPVLAGLIAEIVGGVIGGLPGQIADAHKGSLLLGVLVIAVLIGWQRVPAPLSRVPGPLVAVVGAAVLSLVAPFDVARITFDGSLLDAVTLPELPHGNWGAVATGVLTVALIAGVQSLLTATAVDRMHSGARTDFDRELIGQGAANIAAGALGGLPVAGVIVRSSTNIAAGTRVTLDVLASYLDRAVEQALVDWQHQHRATGGVVTIRRHTGHSCTSG